MSKTKKMIFAIIALLLVLVVWYYNHWRNEDFMPPNEKIITVNFENTDKKVFIKAKTWGVAGNHEEIVLSLSNANISNKESDYIFYSNEVYYKTDSIQTITIFAPESSISEPLNKFTNTTVKINGLKNADEIKDYALNYQKYGLKKVNVYK